MKAKVVFVDTIYDEELIEINDHKLQFGGSQGDGYCYNHQSFDCMDNLTLEEWEAIAIARAKGPNTTEVP